MEHPHPLPPELLYIDEHLLAVHKPSGTLVHRGWGQEGPILVAQVRQLLQTDTAYPIHRLDRPTSGVVLFARDPTTAKLLNEAFDARTVGKHYLALVRGHSPAQQTIDHPIARRDKGPRVFALSHMRTLATLATTPRHASLVEVRPQTGRLHQVRRHLKHIHHPILGDTNYGKGPLNRAFAAQYGLTRLALHAALLTLNHPITDRPLRLMAPLPNDLRLPLEAMGLTLPPQCDLDQLATILSDPPVI